jgi:hypothetical protein
LPRRLHRGTRSQTPRSRSLATAAPPSSGTSRISINCRPNCTANSGRARHRMPRSSRDLRKGRNGKSLALSSSLARHWRRWPRDNQGPRKSRNGKKIERSSSPVRRCHHLLRDSLPRDSQGPTRGPVTKDSATASRATATRNPRMDRLGVVRTSRCHARSANGPIAAGTLRYRNRVWSFFSISPTLFVAANGQETTRSDGSRDGDWPTRLDRPPEMIPTPGKRSTP